MRLAVCLTILVLFTTLTEAALAQEDPREELAQSPASSPRLRLEFMPNALYLVSLGTDGSRHFGPEFSLGISIPFEPDWSVIVRGRGALAFDERTPPGEANDSSCGGGFWSWCSGDSDFRAPVGMEIGTRFDHVVIGNGRHALLLGFDIAGSITYYANFYEHIEPSLGLGVAGALRLGYRRNRFTVSLAVGGRLEGDPLAETAWAGATAGLNFSFAFQ